MVLYLHSSGNDRSFALKRLQNYENFLTPGLYDLSGTKDRLFAGIYLFLPSHPPAGQGQPRRRFILTNQPMNDKASIILANIHARKSVRNFTGEPVAKEGLTELLKAGMAAPSARNRQPWAFIVVTERRTLDALAEGLPYTKMLFRAGAAIVVCGDTRVDLQQGATDLWYQDAAAATENILLAAEALALGAVWSALYPYPEREDHVRTLVGLPEGVIPFSIIPVGHPAGGDQPKDKFRPDRIHWEQW